MSENTGLAKSQDAARETHEPFAARGAAPCDGLTACVEAAAEVLYAAALHRHLRDMPRREIDFFVNARRLELLDRLAGPELRKKGTDILNAACGPFALEFYLQLRDARITSFDREPCLVPLHRDLVSSGLIAQSNFEVADVSAFRAPRAFNAIIINDLFYSKHVDFYGLIDKYIGFLKPSGLLYFDIQDRRAGPIWRAFGKDSEYRRYDLSEVAGALRSRGMMVETMTPVLGVKGGVDRVLRQCLWQTAGLANSFAFVARKTAGV